MKIVYCGYHGLYIPALAGYIHLLDLQTIQQENKDYLLGWIDGISRARFIGSGDLLYLGMDKDYNEIYSLGCKNAFGIIQRAQKGITTMYRNLGEEMHHVDLGGLEGQLYRLALGNTSHFPMIQGAAIGYLRYYTRRQMVKILEKVLLVKKTLRDGG